MLKGQCSLCDLFGFFFYDTRLLCVKYFIASWSERQRCRRIYEGGIRNDVWNIGNSIVVGYEIGRVGSEDNSKSVWSTWRMVEVLDPRSRGLGFDSPQGWSCKSLW